eukprot:212801_1
MNLIVLATHILLLSIAQIHSTSALCRAIYEEPPKTYALDVCSENTVLGVPIREKYYCQYSETHNGEQVYRGFWLGVQCSGNPDAKARIESDIVCNGTDNCPYATVRLYQEWSLNCYSEYYTDTAIIVDVCQTYENGSEVLECDHDNGITRKTYTGTTCEGDAVTTTVLFPGNNTCIENGDGIPSKFVSCHTRSNATSPIPLPTSEPTAPTPKPTAGGSASPSRSPTTPTTAPIMMNDTEDTWF